MFLNSGHLKLSMHANTFGITTNIVKKDKVCNFQNNGMEIYGGKKGTNNNNNTLYKFYRNKKDKIMY